MPQRIELTEAAAPRRTLDAGWTKQQKITAGVASGVLGVAVLVFGGWTAWQNRPVSMPKTAAQAVAMVESGRIDRLDEGRRREYLAEAGRLLRDMPREEARAMFSDDESREAMMDIGMEMFDESARRFARGEGLMNLWQDMRGPRGRGGPERGERDGEGRGRGEGGEPMNDEERAARRSERRAQMTARIQGSMQSGSAQGSALRAEFFKRMSKSGFGGGRPSGRR